jgi:hypothetical protein
MSDTKQSPLADKIVLGGLAVFGAYLIGSMLDGQRRGGGGTGDGGIDPRHFAVKFSVNNAPYQFLGSDPERPERPFKTHAQAVTLAQNFMQTSTPVTGKAKVIDVKTGREVSF